MQKMFEVNGNQVTGLGHSQLIAQEDLKKNASGSSYICYGDKSKPLLQNLERKLHTRKWTR